MKSDKKIGLALGGGAARGWAHIGVIRALEAEGIKADMICGTSMGALVGAAYASGEFDRFENWVSHLSMIDVLGFLDITLNGGLLKGDKLMEFFIKNFSDRPISELSMPFAAVATNLQTGAEEWLRSGSLAQAVRASIALPGLLTPTVLDGKTLVDGGLVNPVPVSLARAMGADIVIAVDLNADMIGRHIPEASPNIPSMFDVIASGINIMQVRITRSRMAGEPPDAIIMPKLAKLGLMDFHRGEEAMAEGKRAVRAVLPNIQSLLT